MIQHVHIGLFFRKEAVVDALATKTLSALRAGFPSPHPDGCWAEIRSRARRKSCRQDKGVRCLCSQAHLYAVLHVNFWQWTWQHKVFDVRWRCSIHVTHNDYMAAQVYRQLFVKERYMRDPGLFR